MAKKYRMVTWVDGKAQVSEHTVTNEYRLQAERALKLRSDIRDQAPTMFFIPVVDEVQRCPSPSWEREHIEFEENHMGRPKER